MHDQVGTSWKHSFVNYENAFQMLRDSLINTSLTFEEKEEIIQFFKMSFELGWKLMRDYLIEWGNALEEPHDVIKKAYEMDIIKRGDVWMQAMEDSRYQVDIAESENQETKQESGMKDQMEEEIFNRIQNLYLPEFHDFTTFFRQKYDSNS